jgi:hypothetical protein
MKTIWVIERGSYSDYRVVGVYSTKKRAELVLKELHKGEWYTDATIAEWPLDPGFEELNAGLTQWRVLMLKDGTVERADHYEMASYDIEGKCHVWERSKAPAYKGQGIQDALDATVWAKDKKHAVKVTNERRTQMIATGKWK